MGSSRSSSASSGPHADAGAARRLDLPLRLRRLRRTEAVRALVRETVVRPDDLVQPLFVREGEGEPEPIGSLPGQFRWPLGRLVVEAGRLAELGIRAVALFPVIDAARKDLRASEALNTHTLALRAARELKRAVPGLLVIADVALDPYTSHGHDGIVDPRTGEVLNDETVAVLVEMAVRQAEAGVDIVAPSDMMDGRVWAIRRGLDEAGHTGTAILAYAAKFASAYYGPFREAVGSAAAAGTAALDKRGYQLDPANAREALREVLLDEWEGADMVMVKPALPYLDIVRDVRAATRLPVAAYQVSGEYAQIHAAARAGWLDLARARDEALLAILRAGADFILTYFAGEVAAELGR